MTHVSTQDSLVVTRRTSEPFVFRSGGLMGGGRQARSIRAAIRHMDRYPEDGVYHLRNGTLAKWLDAQGAEDLAKLAREVARAREPDPRVMVEKFLIGTGLVRRPRLSVRPKAMTLRYILAGQQAECLLRVRKGRGRGYLFGVLHTSQPWIRVDPIRFSGKPLESLVSVGTESLPISTTPHAGEILVESSATAEPLAVPLRFKVVGAPSRPQRWLIRPLTSLILAAALGALLGVLIASSGMGFPTQPLAMLNLTVGPVGGWAALVGLVWGILGLILGIAQPLAWPIWYANGRWLLRTLIWGATFTVLVAIGLVTWRLAYPTGQLPFYAPTRAALWFAALALAIFPAALGELWGFHTARGRTVRLSQQPLLRAGLLILITGFLALALIVGIRLVGPTIERIDMQQALQTSGRAIDEQWIRFEGSMNRLVDDLTIRLFDRRAKP